MFLSRKENLPHYFKLVIGFKNFYTIPIETSPIFYSSIHSFANARSLYSLNYRKNIIHFHYGISAYHLHRYVSRLLKSLDDGLPCQNRRTLSKFVVSKVYIICHLSFLFLSVKSFNQIFKGGSPAFSNTNLINPATSCCCQGKSPKNGQENDPPHFRPKWQMD